VLGNLLSGILLALIGAALLFNGYRWFRVLLPIWAFLSGYAIVAGLISAVLGENFFGTALAVVPGIVLGLIFALLSFLWWRFAVLFWAATVGYVLSAGLFSALGIGNWLVIWLTGLSGAIVFIVLGMRADLHRFLPIFLTAGAGATLLLSAWLVVFGRPLEELNWGTFYGPLATGASGSWLAILGWLLLAGVGIGAQTASNNRSLEVDPAQYQLARP
jgi:hypothetical protein